MIPYSIFIIVISLLIGGSHSLGPKKLVILDNEPQNLDIEPLARSLCKTTKSNDQQISRISTIKKLALHFANLPEQSDLIECKLRVLEPLSELNDLVSVSLENVCSDEKVTLIESYHTKYISTNREHVLTRVQNNINDVPQILRLFFMHYAMEVSAICKRHLINNLEWDLKETFKDVEEFQDQSEATSSVGSLFSGAIEKFTKLYMVDNFDDVVLFWDLVQGSLLNKQSNGSQTIDAIRDEYDETTGTPVRLLVKVRDARSLQDLRLNCLNKYKPIYEKLILPIIRLSDLGYSNTGEQFEVELKELKQNSLVKHWYSITQFCEAVIPMKFYPDPEMEPTKVTLITREEADQLEREQNEGVKSGVERKPLEYEPTTNSMVHVDKLESVETSEAQSLVNNINSSLSVRDRITKRAMIHMFHNIKSQFKNILAKRFSVSFSKLNSRPAAESETKGNTSFVEEDVGEKFSKSLDQLDDADLLKMEGAIGKKNPLAKKEVMSKNSIERNKRRRRKGDVDMIKEMRASQLSYRRTKTWTEIWDGWVKVLETLAPSRMAMILVGGFIIGFLIMLMVLIPIAAAG